ncbi:MAG: NAD(P)/FAD-dependent oxidoreductase [Kiritimatiellia bacterium]
MGGEIPDRQNLALQTRASLTKLLHFKVRARTEALAIDHEAKTVHVRDLKSGAEENLPYDRLVLSPGASPLTPPLPGIDLEGKGRVRLPQQPRKSVCMQSLPGPPGGLWHYREHESEGKSLR